MQQTGLNILAVGIFAMTLSVLLGPFLHIPPLLPAATTLAVLGLVTVDTLGWQNRGMTLFLDLFTSSEQRQRIVHHEAGHLLTAHHLGIPVKGYSLTAWQAFRKGYPGKGGVQFDTEILAEQMVKTSQFALILERFSTVWMAGIAAEMLIYGEAEGGNEDRQQLKMALNLAGIPQTRYAQQESWALLQAKNLIERHQSDYDHLVKAMEKGLSVEECYLSLTNPS